MSSKQQTPGEMTFQADVGPGDLTGVYYITFCNLPFETSWQQLKDWLRPHCEVEHIEVFKNSTSGWVRVRGRENFDKAWKRLDGGVFHGRSIIASDKNKSEAIKIKEALDPGNNASRERQRSGDGLPTEPVSPPARFGSPGPPKLAAQPPVSNGTRYIRYPGMKYPPTSPYAVDYSSLPQNCVPPPDPSSWPRSPPSELKQAFQVPYRPSVPNNYVNLTQMRVLQHALGCTVHGEVTRPAEHERARDPFKIVLKNIPHRSNGKDIESWVRRRLGISESGLDGVDTPVNISGAHSRGSAMLRLNGLVESALVIKKLHQHTFRGRTVSASLVDDEAACAKGNDTTTSTGSPQGGERTSAPSNDPSSARPSESGPLVVEGSSRRGAGPGH